MKEKYITICPVCNSPDVSPDFSIPAAVAYGALYNYRCNHCGYTGPVFLEISEENMPEVMDPEEIPRKFPVIDVSYGKGYLMLLKYLSVFGMFFYLVLFVSYPSLYFLLGLALFTFLSVFLFFMKREVRSPLIKIAVLLSIGLYVIAFRIL